MIFRRKNSSAQETEATPDARASIDRALRFAQKKTTLNEVMAKEAIRNTLLAIEKAMQGLDAIQGALHTARDNVEAGMTLDNDDQRQLLKDQFYDACHRVETTILHCTVDGKNLLSGEQTQYQVPLSDQNDSNFLIICSDFTVEGIGLGSANTTFHGPDTMRQTIELIDRALAHAAHVAKTYCANAAVLSRHLEGLNRR